MVAPARRPPLLLLLLLLLGLLLPANGGGVSAHAVRIYDELHIGGIFPIAGKGGWQGGQACMPAARMALEDVNNENNLLPGFKLTLHSNDSEVSVCVCRPPAICLPAHKYIYKSVEMNSVSVSMVMSSAPAY